MKNYPFDLYHIDKKYLMKASNVCSKVRFEKENAKQRPHIGVIIHDEKNKITFFVPLGSKKEKFFSMPNSLTLFKLDNGNLGVLNVGNIIPVPLSKVKPIKVNELFKKENLKDRQYAFLLKKQMIWIKNKENKNAIINHVKKYLTAYYNDKIPEKVRDYVTNINALKILYKREMNKENELSR